MNYKNIVKNRFTRGKCPFVFGNIFSKKKSEPIDNNLCDEFIGNITKANRPKLSNSLRVVNLRDEGYVGVIDSTQWQIMREKIIN